MCVLAMRGAPRPHRPRSMARWVAHFSPSGCEMRDRRRGDGHVKVERLSTHADAVLPARRLQIADHSLHGRERDALAVVGKAAGLCGTSGPSTLLDRRHRGGAGDDGGFWGGGGGFVGGDCRVIGGRLDRRLGRHLGRRFGERRRFAERNEECGARIEIGSQQLLPLGEVCRHLKVHRLIDERWCGAELVPRRRHAHIVGMVAAMDKRHRESSLCLSQRHH